MQHLESLVLMLISIILIFILGFFIKTKYKSNHSQLKKMFTLCLVLLFIWILCFSLQIIFQNTRIDPMIFEGFASFGACFIPVSFMLLGIVFSKTKIKLSRLTLILLCIIPITSTIIMFTNNYNHLMYEQYSLHIQKTVFGPYFPIHSIYSYICIFIGLWNLLSYTIKNSGFFSKQSILILVGVSIPFVINIIATLGILDLTVYATPIAFARSTFLIPN